MQSDSGKYILGGGITGLVWKFYHPEYKIITPEVGGSYGKTYMVWLHDTYETRRLLTDLGLPIKPKKSYMGYFHKGWISENLTTDMNLVMIQKKMTLWDQPLDTSFVPKTRDLSMTVIGSTNYMNTLDVDLVEVIKRLYTHANDTINGFVTKISPGNLTLKKTFDGPEDRIPYSKIVSTIPAPFFWKAWGTEKTFKAYPITNIVTSKRPTVFDDRYEMIYYDDSVPFTRVSHLEGKYALEFTGEITKEKFQELFPELPIEDYFVVKQGRIFEGEPNLPPTNDITFSGRFGQWKYGITTEHVVHSALNYEKS